MAVIPVRVDEQLAFFEAHAPVWEAHAAALGLDPGAVAAFAAATAEARAAHEEAYRAMTEARAAAAAARARLAAAHAGAADLIRAVRARAEGSADPADLYALARIPERAPRRPAPPPGLPTGFRVSLDQAGGLTLRWRCTNPKGASGTVYTVERRIGPDGPLHLVGIVGAAKAFRDTTFPAGAPHLEYRITGQRSGIAGPSALWTVRFGREGPAIAPPAPALPAPERRAA